MSDLREFSKTIEVPPNTGLEGFLQVVREVLRLPRIQKLNIDRTGHITYFQLAKEEGEVNLNVSFDHLAPYYILKNAPMREVTYPSFIGSVAILASMLDHVAGSGHTPIAFVASPQTVLWSWLSLSDDFQATSRDVLLGYPLYTDRNIPDTALVLCAGVDRTTSLKDTKFSIKVEMQTFKSPLKEEVEIT